MARLDDNDFYDILNANFLDNVAAAYTIYETLMIGTKKKKISKEDFVDMYRNNITDFKVIMDRKVEKENV